MLENKDKFYLYDRWFYYLKEDNEKVTYTSLKSSPLNGIILQLNKEDKSINILYFENKKLISKIFITDITKPEILATYKEKEPQMIVINNNIYVNLLISASTIIEDNHIKKTELNITKKRNLTKLCYCEPTFPIDENIDIKSVNINSSLLNYFIDIVDTIKFKSKKIIESMETNEDKVVLREGLSVKNLTIPDEIFFYDRYYQLDKTRPTKEEIEYKPDDTIYYTNKEDGLYNLEIKYDPDYKFLTGINFKVYDIQNRRVKYVLELREQDEKIKVSFYNTKKEIVSFNTRKEPLRLTDAKNTIYRSVTEFDENNNITSNIITFESAHEAFRLTYNPYFSNTYTDENGNEYHIRNSTFSMLNGISKFSPKTFKQLKKTFTN